tara:strand:+ start:1830 stop:3428 length:1599 start_codon:yes stop_codon:yes gene_type:complete
MSDPNTVIIFSDGPLTNDFSSLSDKRPVVTLPIQTAETPFAEVATTIATGVNAMHHGIVTPVELDENTLDFRFVDSSDWAFPAFWSQGIRSALFGWPATAGDSDAVCNCTPRFIREILLNDEPDLRDLLVALPKSMELPSLDSAAEWRLKMQLKKIALADLFLENESAVDVVALALKCPDEPLPDEYNELLRNQIETFVSKISIKTNIILIQRISIRRDGKQAYKYLVTYLLSGDTQVIKSPRQFDFANIGGSIYSLNGRVSPHGVAQNQYGFLPCLKMEESRPFPNLVNSDQKNWDALIKKLISERDNKSIDISKAFSLLITRFVALSDITYKLNRWDYLQEYSDYLIDLRGYPRDHWLKILSLQRQNKKEELSIAIDRLEQGYSSIPITMLAKSLVAIDHDLPSAISMLQGIDVSEIKILQSLGIYGVLAIRAGLIDQGIHALERAVDFDMASGGERVMLALQYFNNEADEKALEVLGGIGFSGGKIEWRILRLKILIRLDDLDKARSLADSILEQDPTNELVPKLMPKS